MLSAALVALVALVVAGCGGASDTKNATASGGGGGAKLSLVAYSTPQVVYDELAPKFAATPDGKGTSFSSSYGASGDQSRAVESGLPADVVAFSLAPDITRLVKANLVASDWATSEPHKGIVTDSVTTFFVRKGNPKHIKTWADLLKPGVQVLTPNPFTSGGARWNIMAAYGAQLKLGKTKKEAMDYVTKLLSHVSVFDKSAREALQTFLGGKGDVLLSYENEAIFANKKGQKVPYVIPRSTI